MMVMMDNQMMPEKVVGNLVLTVVVVIVMKAVIRMPMKIKVPVLD
jgi:hypothetical protein